MKATKKAFVDFVDIDKEAVKQIRINLAKNRISLKRYRVYCSDMFSLIQNKKYDFILANPPYVALERIKEVDKEVLKNEPRHALFAGEDGLLFIKKLLNEIDKHLKCFGYLFMELDPLQRSKVEKILRIKFHNYRYGFEKDQYKRERFLILQKLC